MENINNKEKEAIERIKYNDIAKPLYCGDLTICNIDDLKIILNLIEKLSNQLEEKDNKIKKIELEAQKYYDTILELTIENNTL